MLFTVAAADAVEAALHSVTRLFRSPLPSALQSFSKIRGSGRHHIEVPLRLLPSTPQECCTPLQRAFPPPLLAISTQLQEAAKEHVRRLLQGTPYSSFLSHLDQRSVCRIIEYPAGVGCPAHYDPGLCTALLLGSQPGLEISAVPDVWKPVVTEEHNAALLHNLQLAQLLPSHTATLHRVNSTWQSAPTSSQLDNTTSSVRHNIIVELRLPPLHTIPRS